MIPSIQKRRGRKPAMANNTSVGSASDAAGDIVGATQALGDIDPQQTQPAQLAEPKKPEPWAAVDPEAGTVSVLDMRMARAIAHTPGEPDRSVALLVVAAYERGRAVGLSEG